MPASFSSHPPPEDAPAFYAPGQYSPQQSVGYLMRKVLGSILSQADARLAMHDVTYVQYLPLYKLLHCEAANAANATVATLARELEVDAGAITRAIDRLEAKGLVQRERATHDRRVVLVALTDAGRAVASQLPALLGETQRQLLHGFDEDEQEALRAALDRLEANLQNLATTAPDSRDGLGHPSKNQ